MEKLTVAGEGSVHGLKDGEEIVVQFGLGLRALFLFSAIGAAASGAYLMYNALGGGHRVYTNALFAVASLGFSCLFCVAFFRTLKKWVIDARGVRCGRENHVVGVQWSQVREIKTGFLGYGLVLKDGVSTVDVESHGSEFPRVVMTMIERVRTEFLDLSSGFMSFNYSFVSVFVVVIPMLSCLYMDLVVVEGLGRLVFILISALVFLPVLPSVVREPLCVSADKHGFCVRYMLSRRRVLYEDVLDSGLDIVKGRNAWQYVLTLKIKDEQIRLSCFPRAALVLYVKTASVRR